MNCSCLSGFNGEDGADCTACAPGLYKEGNGTGVCVACGESLYSATPGATSLATCLACPLHTWAHAGSSAILNCTCVAGHTGDAAVCAPCVAGTYKLTNGSAACDLCGADQYATAVGAATLDVCSACPAHAAAAAGSSDIANCSCVPGYIGEDGINCTACLPGTYKVECPTPPRNLNPENPNPKT